LFKGYVDTCIDEAGLRFVIYYYRNQWKQDNLLLVVYYTNFKMKRGKLIPKIIVHSKQLKKREVEKS